MHKLVTKKATGPFIYVCRGLKSLIDLNSEAKTSGIIVIGDEILKGQVLDTNTQYMTKTLHNLGVVVNKVSIIPDDIDQIANEVRGFSEKYDFVLTSGGIGPTHDDVTFEAIAKAFGDTLAPNPTLIEICYAFYNTTDLNAPGMKLAFIPTTAVLKFAPGLKVSYPLVSVRNVYIFAGIPQHLQRNLDAFGEILFKSDCKFYVRNVYFQLKEHKLVEVLHQVVEEYPDCIFGSYPELSSSEYQVKITIESTNKKSTEEATKRLLALLPNENPVVD